MKVSSGGLSNQELHNGFDEVSGAESVPKYPHKSFLRKAKLIVENTNNALFDEPVFLEGYEEYVPQMFLSRTALPDVSSKSKPLSVSTNTMVRDENIRSANSIIQTDEGLFEINENNTSIEKNTLFEKLVAKVLHAK